MKPIERALWYVESHFNDDIDLDEVAAAAGISRFYLARAFATATGLPVMKYARARRLTEAARALAHGNAAVSLAAIDAGYGSHEAFTRAFRNQFGTSPKAVRSAGSTRGLDLVEPIRLGGAVAALDPPRLVRSGPMLVAGLRRTHERRDSSGVPAQWQRFRPYLGHVPGQVGTATYGVCRRIGDEVVEYLCGVAVAPGSEPHPELVVMRLPEQRCAVFAWQGHASGIHRIRPAIRARWGEFVDCDERHGCGFERYDEDFDIEAGVGRVEIWLPLQPRAARPDRRPADGARGCMEEQGS